MPRTHVLALAFLLLAAAAMLSAAWLVGTRATGPTGTEPPASDPPMVQAAPAVDGVPRPADAAAAPRREEVHDVVEVTGVLVGLGAVTLYLEGETGAILKLGRSEQDGRFRFRTHAPLEAVGVHTIERDGKERRRHFTRAGAAARTDWDLGVVTFPGDWITVRLQVDYEPALIAEMLACGQDRVTARVHESRGNGPVLAEHGYDLAQLPASGTSSACEIPVESHGDGNLAVEWQGQRSQVPGAMATFRSEQVLPATAGPYRTTRLVLRAEATVRGRLRWSDGTPVDQELVQYDSDSPVGARWLQHATTSEGRFVFVVGEQDRGRVAIDCGLLDFLTGDREPQVPATAGSTVELRTRFTPIRFRLIGDTGSPVDRYRVEGAWRSAKRGDHHPDGIGFSLRECLQTFPWLEFTVEQHRRVFPVPPTWFEDGPAVREVRAGEFRQVGSLSVQFDARTQPANGTVVLLDLYGTGDLRGYHWTQSHQGPRPWRCADLPIGTYGYEARRWQDGAEPTRGTVLIAAGLETELRLR